MRRVVDCAGAPGTRGNVVIGRGVEVLGSLQRSSTFPGYVRDWKSDGGFECPATCKCQRCGCVTGMCNDCDAGC